MGQVSPFLPLKSARPFYFFLDFIGPGLKKSWLESYWSRKWLLVSVHFFSKKRPGPTYVGPGPQVWSAGQKYFFYEKLNSILHILKKKMSKNVKI